MADCLSKFKKVWYSFFFQADFHFWVITPLFLSEFVYFWLTSSKVLTSFMDDPSEESRDIFSILSNICDGVFWENSSRLLAVTHFRNKES